MVSLTDQTCFYCRIIKKYESDYPLRHGHFTVDDTSYRCRIHSQFQCSRCQKFHHFSWLYWCNQKQELICGNCNPPILHPLTFWNTTYTYSFQCSVCGEAHFDLYYLEFQGNHPWQLNMEKYTHSVESNELEFKKWKPEEVRNGKEISIDEAFKIQNVALSVRKEMSNRVGTVRFHSPLVNQNDLNQTEVRTHWEQTSKNWIDIVKDTSEKDMGDLNRQLIIDPVLWKVIGKVNGLSVLDAGCGNGYFSRALALKGALVTGVDHSEVFINFCKTMENKQSLGINYHLGSLDDLHQIADDQFDLVVSNIVFVDVLNYKEAFNELARVLKPEGRFIWSNLHPVFGRISNLFYRLPYDTPRNDERLYLIIDRYFDSGGTLISWGSMEPIWQFDRTLSEYSTALKEAGFVIREIIEPKPKNEVIKTHPRFLAFDTDRIPFFIIYECIKYK